MEQVWSTATLWIGLALLASIISVRTAISVPAIRSGLAIISILLVVKVAAKFAGVWPLTRAFNFSGRDGMYTTLLMSTGLTFGSIAALYGYTNHYIDRDQYTVLVTVVIGSAVLPTIIAQTSVRVSKRSSANGRSAAPPLA